MYIILGLLLAIPTLVGIVIAWYQLVRWGEIHIKPHFGDRQGFIISAVIMPAAFVALISTIAVLLGRENGAYFLGAVLIGFAVFGLFWLYLRFIWR